MELTYPAASDLNADRVSQLLELLTATWSAYDADADLRAGNLRSLVLHPQALLVATQEQAILNAIAATSLTAIAANPALASDSAVDRILGNFGLVRKAGVAATGQLTVVIASLQSLALPGKTKFTCNGIEFATDAAYTIRTDPAQVVSDTDRALFATSGGYGFTVNATATNAGASGNVRQGTAATIIGTVPGLVRAYAATDFAGGSDAETNAQLVARQQTGLAAKAWSNRATIRAATIDAAIPVQAMAIVGTGQAEMQRDQRAVWPVGTGSRADMWLRTANLVQVKMVAKTATLISKVGAVGTWQLAIGRDDAPGFYEVRKVLLPTADQAGAGFSPSSLSRGKDVGADAWTPVMPQNADAVFSRYQTGVCQFADNVTDATALTINVSTKTYNVYIACLPRILEAQSLWSSLDRRPPGGDMLVRAAVPCFMTVSATFTYAAGTAYDAAKTKAAVAAAVNALEFPGAIAASQITQAIHSAVPGAISVSSVSLQGRLLKPDGTSTTLSSSSAITIANDFSNMVSGKTVAFFLDPADITLSATAV